MSGKGSSFEREICRKLSLWWSGNKADDVFWRSAGSGAMAKTRSKKGKSTFGQYGDIQATDPRGQPLLDTFTIELKRGYHRNTIQELLDHPPTAAKQQYEKFYDQVFADQKNAKSLYWMLIVKRDRREPLVVIPFDTAKLINALQKNDSLFPPLLENEHISANVLIKGGFRLIIYMTRLDTFLETTNRKMIKRLLK